MLLAVSSCTQVTLAFSESMKNINSFCAIPLLECPSIPALIAGGPAQTNKRSEVSHSSTHRAGRNFLSSFTGWLVGTLAGVVEKGWTWIPYSPITMGNITTKWPCGANSHIQHWSRFNFPSMGFSHPQEQDWYLNPIYLHPTGTLT